MILSGATKLFKQKSYCYMPNIIGFISGMFVGSMLLMAGTNDPDAIYKHRETNPWLILKIKKH